MMEIGVVVEDVYPPPGEGDESPKVEVDNTIGVHEELCVRNVIVEKPVAVIIVLNFKGGDVVEAAKQAVAGDGLMGPFIKVFGENIVCSRKIIPEGFVESCKVGGLALSVSAGFDI